METSEALRKRLKKQQSLPTAMSLAEKSLKATKQEWAKEGLYAKMWKMQVGGFLPEVPGWQMPNF